MTTSDYNQTKTVAVDPAPTNDISGYVEPTTTAVEIKHYVPQYPACPGCGYCPSCGRPKGWPIYPYIPYQPRPRPRPRPRPYQWYPSYPNYPTAVYC